MAAPDDAGQTPVALGAPAMTRVRQFTVSPDGGAVAWIADGDMVDQYDLYVSEISNPAAIRVSMLSFPVNDVEDFQWAPDSQSLAFRADDIIDDRFDLFRVNRDGSDHYRVYQSGSATIFVKSYGFSPDSAHLFCTMQQTLTEFELRLHRTSTGGEGATSVLFVQPGREILDVTFSPDSQWITMRADHQRGNEQFQVYRRRTDLTTALLLSNGSVGSSQKIESYAWSPDSRWLAQEVRGYPNSSAIGVNTYDLFSSTSRRVASTSAVGDFAWAPAAGGNRLAFVAGYNPATNSPAGTEYLLVHDPVADTLTIENAAFNSSEEIRREPFAWSPDGTRIAYVTRETFNVENTYIVEVGAGQPATMAMDLARLGVLSLTWSPDGERLAVLEHDNTTAFHPAEWHLVDRMGRSVFRSGSFNSYFTSQSIRWSTDSQRAVYAVDAAQAGPDRLRSVVADGSDDVSLANEATLAFDYASAALPR